MGAPDCGIELDSKDKNSLCPSCRTRTISDAQTNFSRGTTTGTGRLIVTHVRFCIWADASALPATGPVVPLSRSTHLCRWSSGRWRTKMKGNALGADSASVGGRACQFAYPRECAKSDAA